MHMKKRRRYNFQSIARCLADAGGMRMVEKLTGKMDVLVAIGFGFFLAWRQNLINFLYPMSAGLVFSPLVCMSFAC